MARPLSRARLDEFNPIGLFDKREYTGDELERRRLQSLSDTEFCVAVVVGMFVGLIVMGYVSYFEQAALMHFLQHRTPPPPRTTLWIQEFIPATLDMLPITLILPGAYVWMRVYRHKLRSRTTFIPRTVWPRVMAVGMLLFVVAPSFGNVWTMLQGNLPAGPIAPRLASSAMFLPSIGCAMIALSLVTRRVGEPVCARCGYDAPENSPRLCPECGSDLDATLARRPGRRRVRPLLLIAGVLLFAGSITVQIVY